MPSAVTAVTSLKLMVNSPVDDEITYLSPNKLILAFSKIGFGILNIFVSQTVAVSCQIGCDKWANRSVFAIKSHWYLYQSATNSNGKSNPTPLSCLVSRYSVSRPHLVHFMTLPLAFNLDIPQYGQTYIALSRYSARAFDL